MLLFDGQVQRDTHVIPMGNYVIALGHQAVFTGVKHGHLRSASGPRTSVAVSRSRRPHRRGRGDRRLRPAGRPRGTAGAWFGSLINVALANAVGTILATILTAYLLTHHAGHPPARQQPANPAATAQP